MSTPPEDAAVQAEADRQKSILLRGAVDVLAEADLDKKLKRSISTGVPLRVKLGVDPTSPSLHLGFTVVLNKLRDFQDLGHQAVLIIGDATAMVGDPTGRNKTRPRLSHEQILKNAEDYFAQAGKVIDVKNAEVRRNSDWLHKLDFNDVIKLMSRSTVARMLERDDFSKRYLGGLPIFLHEFLYPMMQGWDSVMVKSDVELGGTDQLFNLLVGRDLQGQEGQEPQVCLTTPLLIGLDGTQKMSKSYDNIIGISDSADSMVKNVMRVDDSMMRSWFTLLTRIPETEVDALLAEGSNPRDVKLHLGHELAARYHSKEAADEAVEAWKREVSRKELPQDLKEVPIPELPLVDGEVALADLLVAIFPLKSKGEARRLMKGGGVTLSGEKITDPFARVALKGGEVVRAGKQNIVKLKA